MGKNFMQQEVIGVRFPNVKAKIIFFKPNKTTFEIGDKVIAEAPRGLELGEVAVANKLIDDSSLKYEVLEVERKANEKDEITVMENQKKADEAIALCREKVKSHNLEMDVVSSQYTFDRSKLIFYFTADGRVDFRDLVKTLASVFKTRIELRQIGVRDVARVLGGKGICGRNLCCSTFLSSFDPISVKNVRDQGLSLNPAKISGCCGRLMCCLRYEQGNYEELMKKLPGFGAIVQTKQGKGEVTNMHVLRELLKVKLSATEEEILVHADDVKTIKRGSWRAGGDAMESISDKDLKELEGE